ncbi:hypothetical protein WI372_17210 [Gemmatimonadota bacterium DH-20]|uniref:DUF4433 domain-containing protein n=1 Tax=Gaopeijia maritima TaxID=3119007 RepID=A0ABU9EDB2_9BACT
MLSIARLIAYRPWLYHLTSRENLPAIRAEQTLYPASYLLREGNRADLVCRKRDAHLAFDALGHRRVIRDQSPLHAGNMDLNPGTTLADVVAMLNDWVFFWPGKAHGPSEYGHRHFGRYEGEGPVILRVPTKAVIDAAGSDHLALCRYNSGAPRCSGGQKSPRGRATFVAPEAFSAGVSSVVEVAFRQPVPLPSVTEIGARPEGPFVRF